MQVSGVDTVPCTRSVSTPVDRPGTITWTITGTITTATVTITTAIAAYTALLWAYDLLGPMEKLADPATDEEGLAMVKWRERARTEKSRELDSDF